MLELEPEVILLGTGERQRFPPLALTTAILRLGIGIEVMNTAAACRTYNVLASELRRVAAALFIPDRERRVMRPASRQKPQRIDRFAVSPDLEMQRRREPGAARPSSRSPALPDPLPFAHQQLLIVPVCAEPGRIVADDHELAVPRQTAAGVDDLAVGRRDAPARRRAPPIRMPDVVFGDWRKPSTTSPSVGHCHLPGWRRGLACAAVEGAPACLCRLAHAGAGAAPGRSASHRQGGSSAPRRDSRGRKRAAIENSVSPP